MKDEMSFADTKNRMDRALAALKTELAKVQEQDLSILQHFLRIQHDINKLSGQRDPFPRSGSVNSILLSSDDPLRKYSWGHRLISRQQSVPVNAYTIAEDEEVDVTQDQLSSSFSCIAPDDPNKEDECVFNLEQEMKEILPELPLAFQRQISRSDMLTPHGSTVNVQLPKPCIETPVVEKVHHATDRKQSDEKHPLRLLSLIEESGREKCTSPQKLSFSEDEVDNTSEFNAVNLRHCVKQGHMTKHRPRSGGDTLSWYLANISLDEKELPNSNNNYVKQRPRSADLSTHIIQTKRNEYELSLANYLKRSSELWKDVQMDKAENGIVDEKKLAKLKIFL